MYHVEAKVRTSDPNSNLIYGSNSKVTNTKSNMNTITKLIVFPIPLLRKSINVSSSCPSIGHPYFLFFYISNFKQIL